MRGDDFFYDQRIKHIEDVFKRHAVLSRVEKNLRKAAGVLSGIYPADYRTEHAHILLAIDKILAARNRLAEEIAGSEPVESVDEGPIDLSQRGALSEAVKQVFVGNPDRTWTTVRINAELRRKKLEPVAKKPGASINTICKRLVSQGIIEIVLEPSGRRPAEYKLVSNDA